MEMKDYLTNYYERYDENARLLSKHGMVGYITTNILYKLYLKYHLAFCERQDMVGYSHHTLDIFRKE